MYAHKIAEKVFDEFDQIINSLSDSLGFEEHFNISKIIERESEEINTDNFLKMDMEPVKP
jgi:hypothetical protein